MSSPVEATAGHISTARENYVASLTNSVMNQLVEGASVTFRYGKGVGSHSASTSVSNSQAAIVAMSPEALEFLSRSAPQAVSVSQSPQASGTLSREQIAIQLMDAGAPQASHRPTATKPTQVTATERSTEIGTETDNPVGTTITPNAPSVNELRAMSAADRFYALTSLDTLTVGMSADRKTAFAIAYESKSLIIQDASKSPDLDYRSSWTFSAGSTGISESGSFSWNTALAGQLYGQNSFMMSDALFGGTIVSWGQKPSGLAGATSTETSVAAPLSNTTIA